jgi:hypothetical protein
VVVVVFFVIVVVFLVVVVEVVLVVVVVFLVVESELVDPVILHEEGILQKLLFSQPHKLPSVPEA